MARKPMMAGNWKMNNTIAEAVVLTQEISNQLREGMAGARRRRRLPAATSTSSPPRPCSTSTAPRSPSARRTCTGSLPGAFTGEISVPMLKEIGCAYSHRGPFGAPRAVRRDERGREPQGEGAGRQTGLARHRVRGRVAGRARSGHHRRVRVRPGARRVRRHGRAPTPKALRGGLRAHLGHRHGPHRHARTGRSRVRRHPRDARRPVRFRRRQRRCACCTGVP